jgi:hypothetical protein
MPAEVNRAMRSARMARPVLCIVKSGRDGALERSRMRRSSRAATQDSKRPLDDRRLSTLYPHGEAVNIREPESRAAPKCQSCSVHRRGRTSLRRSDKPRARSSGRSITGKLHTLDTNAGSGRRDSLFGG